MSPAETTTRKAAMKERLRELKALAENDGGEGDVLAKIEVSAPDASMAQRAQAGIRLLHARSLP